MAIKRKCSVCGGAVRKYSPSPTGKPWWFECVECGMRMRKCICVSPVSYTKILDHVFGVEPE